MQCDSSLEAEEVEEVVWPCLACSFDRLCHLVVAIIIPPHAFLPFLPDPTVPCGNGCTIQLLSANQNNPLECTWAPAPSRPQYSIQHPDWALVQVTSTKHPLPALSTCYQHWAPILLSFSNSVLIWTIFGGELQNIFANTKIRSQPSKPSQKRENWQWQPQQQLQILPHVQTTSHQLTQLSKSTFDSSQWSNTGYNSDLAYFLRKFEMPWWILGQH